MIDKVKLSSQHESWDSGLAAWSSFKFSNLDLIDFWWWPRGEIKPCLPPAHLDQPGSYLTSTVFNPRFVILIAKIKSILKSVPLLSLSWLTLTLITSSGKKCCNHFLSFKRFLSICATDMSSNKLKSEMLITFSKERNNELSYSSVLLLSPFIQSVLQVDGLSAGWVTCRTWNILSWSVI